MKHSLKNQALPLIVYLMLLAARLLNLQAGDVKNGDDDSLDDSRKHRFQIHETENGLTITFDGRLFGKYNIGDANKPYLWPIIGPSGKAMTRAYPMETVDSESDTHRDHPHHRGLFFGHESAGLVGWKYPNSSKAWSKILDKNRKLVGGDTWHEKATFDEYQNSPKLELAGKRRPATLATIKHVAFKQIEADDQRAIVVEVCDHIDRDAKAFLKEIRTLTFHANTETRMIDFDQTFTAEYGDAVFQDRKDSGLAIRVPVSMAMTGQRGGKVINSEGKSINEAWGKPARWCDYHGFLDGEHLGIAFLNHPSSFRYPTRWHVREYGLFTANPFGNRSFDKGLENGDFILPQGEKLELRHRLIFHVGNPEQAKIEEAWKAYAGEEK